MITIDVSQFREFVRDLDLIRERSIPYAVRNTLNDAAFAGRKLWLLEAKATLTLRNKFTERSIRVDKATGTNLATMQAVLGSVAEHVAEQEQGETHRATGKHGVAIPTASAAGQAMSAAKRTRSVQRKNWLASVSLKGRAVTGRRQKRNAAALAIAARAGGGYVFLDLGRRRGIFRVDGRKRGLRIRMVYDLSRRVTVSKPNEMLKRSVASLVPRAPEIGRLQVLDQLRRTVFRTGR